MNKEDIVDFIWISLNIIGAIIVILGMIYTIGSGWIALSKTLSPFYEAIIDYIKRH